MGRAHSIQEFENGKKRKFEKIKACIMKEDPLRSAAMQRITSIATQTMSNDDGGQSNTHQVTNEKSHMSLEELNLLYDMVNGKKSEIEAVRNSEHLDSMEKRIVDTVVRCLDTRLPEEIVQDTAEQILAVINDTQQTSNLNRLEAELKGLQKKFDDALLTVAQAVEFNEESTFDKARGAKPRMVYREGRFKILRSSTTRREMNSKAFIEKYPFLAADIAKIELGKAETALEKELGKTEATREMAGFCTTNTTHKYEFQARSA